MDGSNLLCFDYALSRVLFYDSSDKYWLWRKVSATVENISKDITQKELMFIKSKIDLFWQNESGKKFSWSQIEEEAVRAQQSSQLCPQFKGIPGSSSLIMDGQGSEEFPPWNTQDLLWHYCRKYIIWDTDGINEITRCTTQMTWEIQYSNVLLHLLQSGWCRQQRTGQ